MKMYDIIEKKRDGKELTYDELKYFINRYTSDEIPDYQAAALLMAIFIRGMNTRETSCLTQLMCNSGDRVNLSQIGGFKVDKHSTGGVGDKTTLVLAPIVAACGLPVVKMSGRGLGHTGGTIDKLESIPGFKTELDEDRFIDNIRNIGIAIVAQTGNLTPADKKLYALRDVTATVNSIPLIASSIMSKKIASGADGIVLDVKCGSGAFMKTVDQAMELAGIMVDTGKNIGKKTVAVVTDMNSPVGNAIGNSLEVKEAIGTLQGKGPKDLELLSFELAARMLELAGTGDIEICRKRVIDAVKSGRALMKFKQLLEAQGGNAGIVNDFVLFKKAEKTYDVVSDREGFVESVKADLLGKASMILGAGRETKNSTIDYSAGILLNKKTGDEVTKGDLLATLYTDNESKINEAHKLVVNSFGFSHTTPEKKNIILAFVN